MLKSLIRVNSNNNKIYLTLLNDQKRNIKYVKKSSIDSKSIKKLKIEANGLEWYSNRINCNLINRVINIPTYYSIESKFISGDKISFKNGYWRNKEFIEIAIDKYSEIWGNLNSSDLVVHGDFSMDNLIFVGQEIFIIDWEHFSKTNIPVGFDGVNLIMEQLYFFLKKKHFNEEVIKHINLMFRKMKESKSLDKIFWNKPLHNLTTIIRNQKNIWGHQVNKLPVMQFSTKEVSLIDKLLCIK